MKIAFLGNFRPRTALNEPFSTESHMAASYEILGHEVLRLQEDETRKRDIPEKCTAFGADLFHWTDTWHTEHLDAFRMLDELQKLKIPSVGHTLDLFIGLDRESWLDTDPWFRCDYFFSADGGHSEIFASKQINHIWLPPAIYAPECYLADPVESLVQDIIFVGSYGYHKQWPYRAQLIDWLRATYGSRFTYYGHESVMRGKRLNQLYASAKVVIGDSCCPGFIQSNYWSDRIPETLGRGGVLIHPWIKGLGGCFSMTDFKPYKFGDFYGLKFQIERLTRDPLARSTFRLEGLRTVKERHTYTHRVQRILNNVFGVGCKQ